MRKFFYLGFFIIQIIAFHQSWAGLLFDYSRLAMKDMDQMNKIVQDKLKEARKSNGDKTIPIKEALQAVFSRPNEDFLIEKITAPLRNELDAMDAWESTILALVDEAIGALKNYNNFQPKAQVTYCIFLENLLSDLKPNIESKFEQQLIRKIQEAKIEVSREAKKERELRLMKSSPSPSKIADVLIKEYEKKKEEEMAVEKAAKNAAEKAAKSQEDNKKK